jgi:hypothetical protein
MVGAPAREEGAVGRLDRRRTSARRTRGGWGTWCALAGALVVLQASCETAPLDRPASGTANRPLETAAAPAGPGSFAGLGPEALAPAAESARPEALDRFRIDRDTARRWALGWLAARSELAGPAHVCFELPWLDAGDEPVAYQFVLTDLADCDGWADLLRHARALAEAARPATAAAGAPGPDELRERTQRSARHFFTLAVSTWSFRHPLRDGVKGLPFWLIASDRRPGEFPAEAAAPVSVYPLGNAGGLIEALDYRSPNGRLLWSHHAGRAVAAAELRWRFDAAGALRDWRALGRLRHADDPAGWVARQAALWLDELDGGAR